MKKFYIFVFGILVRIQYTMRMLQDLAVRLNASVDRISVSVHAFNKTVARADLDSIIKVADISVD